MNRSLLFASLCVSMWVAGCSKEKETPPPVVAEAKPAPVVAEPVKAAPAPVAAPAQAPTPAEWQKLETDTFTAELPGKAAMKEGEESTAAGKVKTLTWSAQTPGAFFAVSVADYPAGMMSKAIPSKVLEGARDGAMANVGGKIEKDFAVFLDSDTPKKKWPGREFDGTTEAGIKMGARLFLVGDRLYQMICVSPTAAYNETDFKKFADSFKLKAEKPAKGGKQPKK